jgi:hypothetical protein
MALEEARATLSVLQELGSSLRLSFEAATRESLPEEMGLLLLRLALAEVLKRAAEEEACEAGPECAAEEWVVGLRRWASAVSSRASVDAPRSA